jgi:hypothetical protein
MKIKIRKKITSRIKIRIRRPCPRLALGDSFSPRLLRAQLAVLSPGPRLAGTPSRDK